MLVVALTFLLIGVISTGQTRESIFHRKESRRGGRVSCILAICLASLLNLIWMLILVQLIVGYELLICCSTPGSDRRPLLCVHHFSGYVFHNSVGKKWPLLSGSQRLQDVIPVNDDQWPGGKFCFPLFPIHQSPYHPPHQTLQFCDGELQQFCALSNTIVVWYYVGLLGALLICLGLVQFIATNAAK
jgi:hypothetical protein